LSGHSIPIGTEDLESALGNAAPVGNRAIDQVGKGLTASGVECLLLSVVLGTDLSKFG